MFAHICSVKVYLISGLAADKRAFQKLELPRGFDPYYLEWMPNKPGESMTEYARRFAKKIDTTTPFVLIGLSFGGMMAQEMNRYVKPVKTIIISSITGHAFLPWYLRLAGRLRLFNIIPDFLFNHPTSIVRWVIGVGRREAKVFNAIIQESDPAFTRWCIEKALSWNNSVGGNGIVHLHGDSDRLLPLRNGSTPYIIKSAGHFMIYDHAKEVSEMLQQILSEITPGSSGDN